ncbi:MAG: 50S ribosomal protein L19 [Candidatus Levybacteria bacterium RIFCSPHIGHO2_02_FULL_37_13]|nr:MAG: 50S ribosomal protein L19 [Candidatus Levybacteria bacterium RIFCSPHIGHO2_02_FULL_37_13]OGH29574.1 MAG: 50S ribosomal protein L19 [Candidatus Levybacteria bacterium RIFCSPHIGHO2_12_FULL_37_9]OGH39892.1 MAG: 50S ribosomal protein L19 [Candidatus Levybacteria bacterium RIFCSPLOWO2_01_FULL_37_26]
MIQTINFVPGDTVRVFEKVKEGEKFRLQAFEGIVLGIKGRDENKTFTVRKKVGDIAVEKIWPIKSPNVDKVEVKKHSKKRVRRAKLYYLRNTK